MRQDFKQQFQTLRCFSVLSFRRGWSFYLSIPRRKFVHSDLINCLTLVLTSLATGSFLVLGHSGNGGELLVTSFLQNHCSWRETLEWFQDLKSQTLTAILKITLG